MIGDIAANTTVQVVVSVTIDTAKQQLYYSDDVTSVQKRSVADVIIDLRYFCFLTYYSQYEQ